MALFLSGTLFVDQKAGYVLLMILVSMGNICKKSLEKVCNFPGDDTQKELLRSCTITTCDALGSFSFWGSYRFAVLRVCPAPCSTPLLNWSLLL